jgi:hypothetical protein
MDIQLNANQLIEKLEKRLFQEIHRNVVLEATIEALQKELSNPKEDEGEVLKIE